MPKILLISLIDNDRPDDNVSGYNLSQIQRKLLGLFYAEDNPSSDRKYFLIYLTSYITGQNPTMKKWLKAGSVLLIIGLSFAGGTAYERYLSELEEIRQAMPAAEHIAGLSFTDAERDSAAEGVLQYRQAYQALREVDIPNSLSPALHFSPLPPLFQPKETEREPIRWELPEVQRLSSDAEIAFLKLPELAALIRSRQITSVELTQIYLDRLKKFDDTLHCVVTLTEELAMQQARRADKELDAGIYRGVLHGIPYGAKDLLAVEGYPTTWGAMSYRKQRFDYEATIIKRLEEAGAVLVAKLTLGALAWGDVWFGGTTRNPWNMKQGSSGSSAGSASATAAGLVGFSIGTETLGSIVSPSTRCSVSGLRPTFGRVSRHGAMALSWSMDKIGPICRSAKGTAMVFEAIQGTDGLDQSLHDFPFNFNQKKKITDLRVAYFEDYFTSERDKNALEALKKLGIKLEPISMPESIPVGALNFILTVEAAAAFDELTRSNRDDELVRQIRNA